MSITVKKRLTDSVSIKVKMRLTDSVISSSRNAAVHIDFNLKYVVSS